MLVELWLFDREQEARRALRSIKCELLKQRDDVGTLQTMPEAGELTFKGAFADFYVCPRLLDSNRPVLVLLSLKAKRCTVMRPLRKSGVQSSGDIVEGRLILVKKLLVAIARLGLELVQLLLELRLRPHRSG